MPGRRIDIRTLREIRTEMIRLFKARTEPFPVENLSSGGAASILVTPNPLPASPTWQQIGANRLVGRISGLGEGVKGIAMSADSVIARSGSADMASLTLAEEGVLGRPAGGSLKSLTPEELVKVLQDATSGTSFPATVWDGRLFTRTDLNETFRYDSDLSAWIGTSVYEICGGATSSITGPAYLSLEVAAFAGGYSAVTGWSFGFDTVVVGMELHALNNSTATAAVTDDGTDVATLSLSAAKNTTNESMTSNTIAAGSIIGMRVTSGTLSGAGWTKARLRRIET